MSIFEDFRRAVLDLATVLPAINSDNRKEVREISLGIRDELTRSIDITIAYIDEIATLAVEKERLVHHLRYSSSSLMDAYGESKVSQSLYSLVDRFKQIFTTLRASLAIGRISELRDLIEDLADGERVVMRNLRGLTRVLSNAGQDLEGLSGDAFQVRLDQLRDAVSFERADLVHLRESIGTAVDRVLARM